MQEGRIDHQFPKRVDQCHVEGREATYAADKDPEVESVSSRCLDQGAQRRSGSATTRLDRKSTCSKSD